MTLYIVYSNTFAVKNAIANTQNNSKNDHYLILYYIMSYHIIYK